MYPKALALSAVVVAAVAGVSALAAGAGPSRADSLSLRQKVAGITAVGERPTRRPSRTTLTENEVNAFLVYDARDQLPVGVVEPAVTIVGTGRVSARALVDLDAVRRQKSSRSTLDPMSYATGRVPVTAIGVLRTGDGVGRFELESATIASIPIPKMLLQEIVSYYSRTAENPAGFGLDQPFSLPAGIREIQVEPGRAIVVQ